jgi:hypothetical protein
LAVAFNFNQPMTYQPRRDPARRGQLAAVMNGNLGLVTRYKKARAGNNDPNLVTGEAAALVSDFIHQEPQEFENDPMAAEFDPAKYHDTYTEDVKKLIEDNSPLCLSCASLESTSADFSFKSATMESQIIQEFRPGLDARHEQVVPGPRAGEET